MPFKFIEDVTLADVAFEATGKTLTELFSSCAAATIETMAEPSTVKPLIAKKVQMKAKDVENLLFEFLEEILFIKDEAGMVFSGCQISVDEKKLELTATLHGDKMNPVTQKLGQDVKAITMHYYKVEKKDKLWKTQIVLDI